MVRRVFFSFHYEKDVWRASIVKNSWVTKPDRKDAGFIDAGEFEKIKKQGDEAIKRWINSQLEGTSVTVVLIGTKTYSREWVRYEIVKSFDRKNGQLGVYIHKIEDKNKQTDYKGANPFEYLLVDINKEGKGKYYEWDGLKWVLFDKYPDSSFNFDKQDRDKSYQFSELYECYDWKDDNGYNNLGNWVEKTTK